MKAHIFQTVIGRKKISPFFVILQNKLWRLEIYLKILTRIFYIGIYFMLSGSVDLNYSSIFTQCNMFQQYKI